MLTPKYAIGDVVRVESTTKVNDVRGTFSSIVAIVGIQFQPYSKDYGRANDTFSYNVEEVKDGTCGNFNEASLAEKVGQNFDYKRRTFDSFTENLRDKS